LYEKNANPIVQQFQVSESLNHRSSKILVRAVNSEIELPSANFPKTLDKVDLYFWIGELGKKTLSWHHGILTLKIYRKKKYLCASNKEPASIYN